jgi:hypothetical protein
VAIALLLVPSVAPASAGAPLEVQLAPAKLEETEVGAPKQVLLVARNGSSSALTHLRLTWFTNGTAVIRLAPGQKPTLRVLPARTDRSWALRVAPASPGAPDGTAFFRIAYRVGKHPGGSGRRVAIVPLEVMVGSQSIEDIVSVEMKTTLEALDQQHPGVLYLVITNKSRGPVKLVSIDATGPDDSVEFDLPKPHVIQARRQASIKVGVHAQSRVEPGKHLLVLDLTFRWGTPKLPRIGHLVETTTAQVGVLGESAVLTLLGVPSFLLLPGFLVLAMIAIGWRLWRPATAPEFPFGVKDPEFWVLAITMSIALALLWPKVGGHSYLRTYGLRDVISLWLVSLVIGGVLYVAIVAAAVGLHSLRTPRSTDDQLTVLRKLAWQRLRLERPRFRFGDGAGTYWGFLIQRADGVDPLWLAPPINVTLHQDASGNDAAKAGALAKKLQAERRPRRLVKLLKKHRPDLDLSWGGTPMHPYTKKQKELTNEDRAQSIVSVQ